jgi:sulfite reductase beta subunit-like hemoprotein
MPMMESDGLLDQAWVMREISLAPGNADYGLQNVVSNAISSAAVAGAQTCTVATAAYANALVQQIIQRLVNMGYTATLSGTTLTVNWSVM